MGDQRALVLGLGGLRFQLFGQTAHFTIANQNVNKLFQTEKSPQESGPCECLWSPWKPSLPGRKRGGLLEVVLSGFTNQPSTELTWIMFNVSSSNNRGA